MNTETNTQPGYHDAIMKLVYLIRGTCTCDATTCVPGCPHCTDDEAQEYCADRRTAELYRRYGPPMRP